MAQAKQPETGKGETGKSEAKSGELQIRRPGRISMFRPFEDIDRMFESFFPRGWMRGMPTMPFEMPSIEAAGRRFPAVDVIEHDNEYILRAEVPGVDKQNLDVSMSDGSVTIRGRTQHTEEEERENFYFHEMSYGEFSRTVNLPEEVDSDKAKATVKDGVLELMLPKRETTKRRSIEIQSG